MQEIKDSFVKRLTKTIITGLFLIFIIAIVAQYLSLKTVLKKEVTRNLSLVADFYNSFTESDTSRYLDEAALFANDSYVLYIYKGLKSVVGDLHNITESNRETFVRYGRSLKEYAEKKLKVLQKIRGVRSKLHFHLPGPRSFVRTWKKPGKDIKLDDLSGFRFAIAKAQREKKIVTGIEPGRAGLIYRTIVPILSDDGEVLGSVESGISLDAILKDFLSKQRAVAKYVVLVNRDLSKIMDFYIKKKRPKVVGNYIVYDSSKNMGLECIEAIAKSHRSSLSERNIYYRKIPIKNYMGKTIGFIALGVDFSTIITFMKMLGIGFAILLLAIFGVILKVTKSTLKTVERNLQDTIKAMQDLSKGGGNLAFRLRDDTEDETGILGRYFNRFMETLSGVIRSLIARTGELFNVSGELKSNTKDIENASESFINRAESINQLSEEILHSIDAVNGSLRDLMNSIEGITSRIIENNEVVKETVKTVEKAKELANKLSEASSEIEDVINIINRITKKTDLLALNASVEAARAGEAGKGFAVVANEVKKLAGQTREATVEIANRIEALKNSSFAVTESVEGIVQFMERVNEASSAIAAIVEQQSSMIKEVSAKLKEANSKVQENKSQADAIMEAAATIASLAKNLKEVEEKINNVANSIKAITDEFKL